MQCQLIRMRMRNSLKYLLYSPESSVQVNGMLPSPNHNIRLVPSESTSTFFLSVSLTRLEQAGSRPAHAVVCIHSDKNHNYRKQDEMTRRFNWGFYLFIFDNNLFSFGLSRTEVSWTVAVHAHWKDRVCVCAFTSACHRILYYVIADTMQQVDIYIRDEKSKKSHKSWRKINIIVEQKTNMKRIDCNIGLCR